MSDHLAISRLFSSYLAAFKQADKTNIKCAYQLPCSLSTPTEIKYIRSQDELDKVIADILNQLVQSQTSDIEILSISYEQLGLKQYIACAHWQFANENKQIFADFCAFYHIGIEQNQAAFKHVISHEQDQKITFAHTIELSEIYK